MYNYEYEVDILLLLRLARFLHDQNPAALGEILEEYRNFDLDLLWELCESITWAICTHVVFDQDDAFDTAFCTFGHPLIDRFCVLGEKWSRVSGESSSAWQRKIHDIAEYYLLGTNYSVGQLEFCPQGTTARLRTWFSSDCYDPVDFGNSLVDMLLCFRRENERLEGLLKEAETRKEAA